MYKYSLEEARDNKEVINLYKLYYPERSQFIVRRSKGRMKYFVVARCEDKVVAAMGLTSYDNEIIAFSHTVTHPDHRRKFVANSIKYLAVKYCFELGAKIISNRKKDNEFSHERLISMGFNLTQTQGRNKQLNRRRKRLGLSVIPVRYYYECEKKDVPWKELNKICHLIESGKQQQMMQIK
jgi:predicted GNAT family acetyltransferase